MKKVYVLSLFVMLFSFTSCWDSDYEEDFQEIKASAMQEDDDDSSSGACPKGRWGFSVCNSDPNKKVIYYFGSDGNGSAETPDCNGYCSPLKFNFKYSISGDKITYNFTSTDDMVCNGVNQGRPNTPTGTQTMTFTCLNGGSQLRTESVNLQTGARTVMTFDRL